MGRRIGDGDVTVLVLVTISKLWKVSRLLFGFTLAIFFSSRPHVTFYLRSHKFCLAMLCKYVGLICNALFFHPMGMKLVRKSPVCLNLLSKKANLQACGCIGLSCDLGLFCAV